MKTTSLILTALLSSATYLIHSVSAETCTIAGVVGECKTVADANIGVVDVTTVNAACVSEIVTADAVTWASVPAQTWLNNMAALKLLTGFHGLFARYNIPNASVTFASINAPFVPVIGLFNGAVDANVKAIPNNVIRNIASTSVTGMNARERFFPFLTQSQVAALTASQVGAIDPVDFANTAFITEKFLGWLTNDNTVNVSAAQIISLRAGISKLTPAAFAALPVAAIAAIADGPSGKTALVDLQLRALKGKVVNLSNGPWVVTNTRATVVTPSTLMLCKDVTPGQLADIDGTLISGECFVEAIKTGSASEAYWTKERLVEPVYYPLAALNYPKLGAKLDDKLKDLEANAFAGIAIRADFFEGVAPANIKLMKGEALAAIEPSSLKTQADVLFESIVYPQVVALKPTQISEITPAQLGKIMGDLTPATISKLTIEDKKGHNCAALLKKSKDVTPPNKDDIVKKCAFVEDSNGASSLVAVKTVGILTAVAALVAVLIQQ